MSVVVDASVLVSLMVSDERQHEVRAYFDDWLQTGETLHAPAVLPFEIANVLARLSFDGVLEGDSIKEIWSDLAALGIVIHSFDMYHDGPQIAAITARLQRRHATDASYICLAQRLESFVWTLDGALARNAQDVGFPVNLI